MFYSLPNEVQSFITVRKRWSNSVLSPCRLFSWSLYGIFFPLFASNLYFGSPSVVFQLSYLRQCDTLTIVKKKPFRTRLTVCTVFRY